MIKLFISDVLKAIEVYEKLEQKNSNAKYVKIDDFENEGIQEIEEVQ